MMMKCNECGHEFDSDNAKWVEVSGGGKIAVCPKCESSDIS